MAENRENRNPRLTNSCFFEKENARNLLPMRQFRAM